MLNLAKDLLTPVLWGHYGRHYPPVRLLNGREITLEDRYEIIMASQ